MATPAWQTRPSQPAGGVQQAAVGGPPQSHWGAPGTGGTPAQGPPRPPYGPPPGPPSGTAAYGQTATPLPLNKGSNQANSGSGGGPPPPTAIPSGSSSGILQSFPKPPPMQALQSYRPPMVPYPGDRWQPPAPGSTPVPSLPPVAPRLAPDGTHAGIPRPAVSTLGAPAPAGSQSVTVVVSAPPGRPSSYQQYPSGPGPAPSPVGPWMPPPQQANPLQQRPPFPVYPGNFQPTFPGPPHPTHGMGGIGPPGGPYGRDLPPTKGVLSPSASGWGQQPLYGAPPVLSSSSEDSSVPSNAKQTVAEAERGKTADSAEDKGSSENAGDASKIGLTELPDVWTAHKTADGTVYYYNSEKGQSTYEKPPGFKGEAEKVTAKTTPVSWERLNGSDWALVTTNDEKKYYYNTKSQATSWQVPPEILEQRKKQLEESAAKAASEVVAAPGTAAEKNPVSFSLNVPAATTGGREAVGHRGIVTNSALDLIKKKLQDPGVPITSAPSPPITGATPGIGVDIQDFTGLKGETSKDKIKGSTVDAVSSESSSESDDEDPGPTKEERVVQFKEMLKEKGIAPFSKWEKELPKIIFDVRFKAIPSHTERRAIFEHYVRTRADEERKEKRAAQKAAVEGFKQLLEEATKEFTYLTTFDQFASTWGQDPRFEALDRKDREALLNERVLPLRRAEEERVKAEHAVAVGGFRAMLVERSDITITTRWPKVRESLRSDSRYINVKREEREGLFNDYVAELVSAEQEAERAAKAKRDEEEKLKEREREVRKRKEREELEMERVRAKARRKDAVNAYQALLTEKIKDPEASWTEARPKLEKDPLGRATLPELEPVDRERFFREHTNEVFERCVRDYRLLLADVITVEAASKSSDDGKQILTSWTEAKKILKLDPRYTKMPRRDRESWWRRYADDVQRRMKLGASTTPSKGDRLASGNGTKSGVPLDASRHSPGSRRHSGRR